MSSQQPILLTGSIRSGSTWAGKMIALSRDVGYIGEPFNQQNNYYGLKKPYFYTYVTEENEAPFVPWMRDILRFRIRKLVSRKLPEQLYNAVVQPRPLIKDPPAALSAAWLAERFNMQVVVMLRHPGAVVHSCLRLSWFVKETDFLNQPLLMRDWLEPYRDQLSAQTDNPVERLALNWLCVYSVLDAYLQTHPAWIVLRYEDLAADPVGQFEALYHRLGIAYTDAIRAHIAHYTATANPVTTPAAPHTIKRDSRSLIDHWRSQLSEAQQQTIQAIAAPIFSRYYAQW